MTVTGVCPRLSLGDFGFHSAFGNSDFLQVIRNRRSASMARSRGIHARDFQGPARFVMPAGRFSVFRLRPKLLADRFEIVALGIDDEGRVVFGTVMQA